MTALIALPVSIAHGDSGTTTLLVDARGTAIGGCYGAFHREHAETIARCLNGFWRAARRERLN